MVKSILVLLGAAVPPVMTAYKGYQENAPWENTMDKVQRMYTGYSFRFNEFRPADLLKGWGPIFLGAVGHKLAVMAGVNRYLPKGINL